MLRALVVIFLCIPPLAGYIQQPVHPDEPADYTMNERFSVRQSMESMARIKSALDSFKKLTEATAESLPKRKLDEIGNTNWEMQNLGFVNHVGTIKGTLLKQEYLLKKLAYELAERKSKSGEIGEKGLLEIKQEYDHAKMEFQKFWEAFGIAD